ncbi:hypothetical protein CDD82_7909 [Ophiocordyceps australis]|uniref:Uncharacterized protein n=1 Tax=Ophiocordyceps australis TaxID=1399860 RepID=A0A2C5XTI0_9HYPO|nr:hypothetical protein CDD82_7909 [Ophiocordyceps australis]
MMATIWDMIGCWISYKRSAFGKEQSDSVDILTHAQPAIIGATLAAALIVVLPRRGHLLLLSLMPMTKTTTTSRTSTGLGGCTDQAFCSQPLDTVQGITASCSPEAAMWPSFATEGRGAATWRFSRARRCLGIRVVWAPFSLFV